MKKQNANGTCQRMQLFLIALMDVACDAKSENDQVTVNFQNKYKQEYEHEKWKWISNSLETPQMRHALKMRKMVSEVGGLIL